MAAAESAPPRQTPAAAVLPADITTAKPAYWLSQPSAESVEHGDFDQLWEACRGAARAASFRVDRTDPRAGLMTTHPTVSKQFFELWRNDVATLPDLAESSTATMRRTARFGFERLEDGTFRVTPKVLIERYAFAERRVTSVIRYRDIFSVRRVEGRGEEPDPRFDQPEAYWYATGRDAAMESRLARLIRDRLK